MILHKHALRCELILASFCSCYDYQELVNGKLQLKQFIHSIHRIDVLLFVVRQHWTNINFVSNLVANSYDNKMLETIWKWSCVLCACFQMVEKVQRVMHKPSKWSKKRVDNNCSKSGNGCKICDMFGYCQPYNWQRKLHIICETSGPILHQDLERGRSAQVLLHTVLWMSRNLWKLLPDLSTHSQLQHSWRWAMCISECLCNTISECRMENKIITTAKRVALATNENQNSIITFYEQGLNLCLMEKHWTVNSVQGSSKG